MSSLLGTRALFAAAAESYHAVGFAACRGCVPPFVLANAEKEVMDVVNSPPVRECVCVCVCVSTAPRITCVAHSSRRRHACQHQDDGGQCGGTSSLVLLDTLSILWPNNSRTSDISTASLIPFVL